jgi:hypothetical protein
MGGRAAGWNEAGAASPGAARMTTELPNDLPDAFQVLGPPRAEFAVRRSDLLWRAAGAALALLAGSALLLFAFLAPRGFRSRYRIKAGVLGFALIGGAVLLALRTFRSRSLRVLVYPEGLLCLRPGSERALFWEDIAAVRHRKREGFLAGVLYASEVVTVCGPDEWTLRLDDSLPRVGELAGLIESHTREPLLARSLEAYKAGEGLDFEEFRVSRAGIEKDGVTLPWNEVEAVELQEKEVAVRRRGKWRTWLHAMAGDVPNFHVLRGLLQAVWKPAGDNHA